ncbi:MAG: L-fuculokinase [Akkermansia muciniphila]|nr:L-fuculokinase [Akkermansia muciniphila]
MSYVLCLDCGATNVRAILVDEHGTLVAKASQPNSTDAGAENPQFHVWNADRILNQLAHCARKIMVQVDPSQVRGVTITTFGVDGALVDAEGKLLYPVISWKCPRTAEVMKSVSKYIPQARLNEISGVGEFAFNTIYKLIWLKENRPELLEKAHAWLFISNLLAHRLTGVMATDRTMAGTSQMTDVTTGDWSEEILNVLGIRKSLFPPMVNAGDVIGHLTPTACSLLGLPTDAALPVISTGHDTQFALFGSGVKENQPFLSSGTWEILMLRTPQAKLAPEDYAAGATVEFDSKPGLLNPGLQWIASGIIEWVKATCYHGESFDTMDAEAEAIPPGCDGVKLVPDFLPSDPVPGSIQGLILGRTRAHIYRAAMEALTLRLKHRLQKLEKVGNFKATELLLVGGGARNKVWTQMRADILGLPILVSTVSESTVLGAAMFAFAGAGIYPSPEACRDAIGISYETTQPAAQREQYRALGF